MKGTIVFDEDVFPIVEIRLADAQIVIVGLASGPRPARTLRGMRLHGEDGQIVAINPERVLESPKMKRRDLLEVIVRLDVVNRLSGEPNE